MEDAHDIWVPLINIVFRVGQEKIVFHPFLQLLCNRIQIHFVKKVSFITPTVSCAAIKPIYILQFWALPYERILICLNLSTIGHWDLRNMGHVGLWLRPERFRNLSQITPVLPVLEWGNWQRKTTLEFFIFNFMKIVLLEF